MTSVSGLLEERELTARERVQVLQAEVDRLLTELGQAARTRVMRWKRPAAAGAAAWPRPGPAFRRR